MLQSLQALWKDLPGLISDRVELLSLELQQAGLALLQILMLAVVVAILGVTAWLVLWVGIVAGLVAMGLHVALALGLALLLNLAAAAMAVMRAVALSRQLRLPATRRHLTLSPSAKQTEADDRHPSSLAGHQP